MAWSYQLEPERPRSTDSFKVKLGPVLTDQATQVHLSFTVGPPVAGKVKVLGVVVSRSATMVAAGIPHMTFWFGQPTWASSSLLLTP
jgi:hypothetical protein